MYTCARGGYRRKCGESARGVWQPHLLLLLPSVLHLRSLSKKGRVGSATSLLALQPGSFLCRSDGDTAGVRGIRLGLGSFFGQRRGLLEVVRLDSHFLALVGGDCPPPSVVDRAGDGSKLPVQSSRAQPDKLHPCTFTQLVHGLRGLPFNADTEMCTRMCKNVRGEVEDQKKKTGSKKKKKPVG